MPGVVSGLHYNGMFYHCKLKKSCINYRILPLFTDGLTDKGRCYPDQVGPFLWYLYTAIHAKQNIKTPYGEPNWQRTPSKYLQT